MRILPMKIMDEIVKTVLFNLGLNHLWLQAGYLFLIYKKSWFENYYVHQILEGWNEKTDKNSLIVHDMVWRVHDIMNVWKKL